MADDGEVGKTSHSHEDIAEVTAYLTAKGIRAKPNGYDENTLAAAIQRNGWTYHFDGMTGSWRAVIRNAKTNTDTAAVNTDRVTALLFALEVALRENDVEEFFGNADD